MCGCETILGSAGGAIAGGVLVHFSSRSDVSAIYDSAVARSGCTWLLLVFRWLDSYCVNKERFYDSRFSNSNTTTGPWKRLNLTAVWYSVRSLILTKIDFVINQFRTNDMEISVALEWTMGNGCCCYARWWSCDLEYKSKKTLTYLIHKEWMFYWRMLIECKGCGRRNIENVFVCNGCVLYRDHFTPPT